MSDRRLMVIGAGGFVGSALARRAAEQGFEVTAVTRANIDAAAGDQGHVIYTVGMTADFRGRPFETVEAHVGLLAHVLAALRPQSFLYLSSTRIYRGAASTEEDADLHLNPNDPDRLYDISKAMGESLCLANPDPAMRVARLSNVYGAGGASANFLDSVVGDAVAKGRVVIGQAPTSEKDYVAVEDVCDALIHIAVRGQKRLYNVAAGRNVTHREIAKHLHRTTGAEVTFSPGGAEARLRPISVDRLRAEMDWRPVGLDKAFDGLVSGFRERQVS